jgi:hypothetical protein
MPALINYPALSRSLLTLMVILLEAGYVYVGTAGLNAEASQIQAYWDQNLTVPAAQPIRTIGGHPSNSGTPARIYVNASSCSIFCEEQKWNAGVLFAAFH